MQLCIVQPQLNVVSETFIRAHAERLPAEVTVVHWGMHGLPSVDGRPILPQAIGYRAIRKASRLVNGRDWSWERTAAYLRMFRDMDAVLAEYGPTAVEVAKACEIAEIPLIAHFHGYDASKHQVLKTNRDGYRMMFRSASAVIAVSSAMRERLLAIGAPVSRTHLNVYGIDCRQFSAANPGLSPATFLAVGRFVEKKAPHLTLLAFAKAHGRVPNARLRMIGDGPLLGPCRDLAHALGVDQHVTFLGAQNHEVVAREMRSARAFVQHSIEAADGDCEGTPLAVLEAGASGLPVIATRHAGIPDVVVDAETGLLVDEKDAMGMAERMVRIALEPELAAKMGQAARKRIENNYNIDESIARLWSIISSCIDARARQSALEPTGLTSTPR